MEGQNSKYSKYDSYQEAAKFRPKKYLKSTSTHSPSAARFVDREAVEDKHYRDARPTTREYSTCPPYNPNCTRCEWFKDKFIGAMAWQEHEEEEDLNDEVQPD